MKPILSVSAVVLLAAFLASPAEAQCCYIAPPRAPDMLNPGFYYYNCYGQVYGPNYCVYPPFPPFQGMVPAPQPPAGGGPGGGPGGAGAGAAGAAAFPTHPFARSPRDYFMIDFDATSNPYRVGYSSLGSGISPQALPGVGAIGDFAPRLPGPGVPPTGPR